MRQLRESTTMDTNKEMNVNLTAEEWELVLQGIYDALNSCPAATTTTPLPPHVPAEQEFNSSEYVDGGSEGYGELSPLVAALCGTGEASNPDSQTAGFHQLQEPSEPETPTYHQLQKPLHQLGQQSSGVCGEFLNEVEIAYGFGQQNSLQHDHVQPTQQPLEIPVMQLPKDLQPVGYMNGFPVYHLPAVAAPVATTSKSRKRKRDDDGEDDRPYVKKPPNAFMLYMKEQRLKYVAEMKVTGTAQVNKALGEKWKSLSDAEKSPYFDEARRAQRLHEQQHPDWSAQANYGKKRKRDRSKAARMARGQ